ncbi:MAG: CotH kinase family protein [Actinomycetota bacterium]|nr:CotH kinase family protein [Actinomycetota bacterium]
MDARRPNDRRPARRPALGAAGALVLLAGCTTGAGVEDTSPRGGADGSGTGLFDDAVVHDIEMSFDQDVYDAMIDAYVDSGSKEWITATVTIDGTTLEDVGLRLKGNSSLAGLAMSGSTGVTPEEGGKGTDGGGDEGTGGDVVVGRGGGPESPGGSLSADDPESLPWLVRLDENVAGQSYEGISEFVVRSNDSETSLNEAVALELIGLAGLATQEAASASLSVNGNDEVLRLVVEHPDDTWDAANFDTEGVLYKAESTGDYSYRGEDPAAYEEVFEQETDKDQEDLAPLIDFLDFINNSDDATFAAELADHLDVDAFARYLAAQDLVANFDDIDGPGNNSYLRYDEETGAFTVVSWDLNLAFMGMGIVSKGDFGGGGGPGHEPPDGVDLSEDFVPPTDLPEGAQPPTEGTDLFGGGEPPAAGGHGGVIGAPNNVLVKRFMADEGFAALYDQALAELAESLYDSGAADEILDRWAETLTAQASDLVSAETIEEEAAALRTQFTSLADTPASSNGSSSNGPSPTT